MESKLKALKGAKGDEIDQMREDALAGIKKAHDTYDTRTQHGATEGVRLTIEDECDSTK